MWAASCSWLSSSISMWPLPVVPMSGSQMKSAPRNVARAPSTSFGWRGQGAPAMTRIGTGGNDQDRQGAQLFGALQAQTAASDVEALVQDPRALVTDGAGVGLEC